MSAARERHYRAYQALSVKIAEELIPRVKILGMDGRPVPERFILRLAVPTIRYANCELRALALDGGLTACVALRLAPISNGDIVVSNDPVDVILRLPALDAVPIIRLAPNSCDIVNPHTLSSGVCIVEAWSPVLSVGANLIPSLINLLTLQPGSFSLDPKTHLNVAAGRWLAEEAPRSGISIPLAPPVSGIAVAQELQRRWSQLRLAETREDGVS